MSRRQKVRLVLSNLLEAKLALKLAKDEHAADGRPETSDRHKRAGAVAARLQAKAQRLVKRVGNAKDKARLAAMLNIRWSWLMVLDVSL